MTAFTAAARKLLGGNLWLTGVALIGFFVSFQTIARLATVHHEPGYPVLYPLLIDVGILAMVVESRRAVAAKRSDLAPRLMAWALIGLTLYVNVHGSPAGDWLGRALHVVAPALWAALLELSRWRELARKRAEKGDPIPLARWVVAPRRTATLRRLMVLWGETDYQRAVSRQAVLLYATAVAQADSRVGSGLRWRRRLPVTLRWQLAEGRPPAEIEAVIAGGAEAWQEAAARWVDGALRMLPASVTQGTPEGTAEVTPEGTAGSNGDGTTRGTAKAPAGGRPEGTGWPETRDVNKAVLARRVKAATEKYEAANPGRRLPATQLASLLKVRMSRDTATALLKTVYGTGVTCSSGRAGLEG